jgi:uncharacterized ion transporter superfamily protein YfcC
MKKREFPQTIALLFFLICVAAILTYILPAGEFDTVKAGRLTKVVAGTYHHVPQTPQGLFAVLNAVVLGFQRASILFAMILFTGAAVHMMQLSGAVEVAFRSFSTSGSNSISKIVFVIMTFMSIGGATGVFANPTVALIPIGMVLAKSIGLDVASGFMMIYLGAYAGFNVGWANPSTLGVAHPIAELPVFSGMPVRFGFHAVNLILSYILVMRYIRSIQKDYTKSLCYNEGMTREQIMGGGNETKVESAGPMTGTQKFCLGVMILSIVAIMTGAIVAKWGNQQIGAIMFFAVILQGAALKLGVNGTTKEFLEGCKPMLNAAFIVGFANGISVILRDGHILNTIVYYLSIPVGMFGPVIGAILMFWANLFINLFIPSGSGQAAAVMPLMVPLADLTGITRQVAVQAFQFGDGLSNCIVPTAGTIMGSLGIAGIAYNRYAKWFAPFLLLQSILASIALAVLQIIGWTGL